MPVYANDIMAGITALLTGLQENMQRGKAEEMKSLQLMAGMPGMQMAPATDAQPTSVFKRLLGMPSYQPGPGGMPVVPIGGSQFTVKKGPSTQDFMNQLLGGSGAGAMLDDPGALTETTHSLSPPTGAGAPYSLMGQARGRRLSTRAGEPSREEILADPEIRALMRIPGDKSLEVSKRISELRKERVTLEKERRSAEQARVESETKSAELIGRHMIGAKDQASLDMINEYLDRVLPPEHSARLPRTFRQDIIDTVVRRAQSVSDQTAPDRAVATHNALAPRRIKEAVDLQRATQGGRINEAVERQVRVGDVETQQGLERLVLGEPSRIRIARAHGSDAAQKAYDTEMAKAQATREGEPLTGEMATKVSILNTMIEFSNDIQRLRQDNFTGKIDGRMGAVREFTGDIKTDEVQFRRLLSDAKGMMINARTGTAGSEQELKRIEAMLPALTDPPNVFADRLQGFGEAVQLLRDNLIKTATTARGKYLETAPRMQTPEAAKPFAAQDIDKAMALENAARAKPGHPRYGMPPISRADMLKMLTDQGLQVR